MRECVKGMRKGGGEGLMEVVNGKASVQEVIESGDFVVVGLVSP